MASQPVAHRQQALEITQMVFQRFAAGLHRRYIGHAAAHQPLFHLFVQQQGIDLEVELALEPADQAAGLGAFVNVRRPQANFGIGFFEVLHDGAIFADATDLSARLLLRHFNEDRQQAGRVEPQDGIVRLPVPHQGFLERQFLFAQRQADHTRMRVEGEMIELARIGGHGVIYALFGTSKSKSVGSSALKTPPCASANPLGSG